MLPAIAPVLPLSPPWLTANETASSNVSLVRRAETARRPRLAQKGSRSRVIRLTVKMYVRYPLSLRQVADIRFERGIDICRETVRLSSRRNGAIAGLRQHFADRTEGGLRPAAHLSSAA